MNETPKKYKLGLEAALEVIRGKWKGSILYHLSTGRKRTFELRKLIPDITQKVLTQQLRELEDDGIIIRILHIQNPPMVEYELSEYAWKLEDVLEALCLWGEDHLDKKYGDKTKVLEDYAQLGK
ncbi:putative HTH-type transcriptional regulator YtcD [Paenibacillus albidus]|uniref:HTH-type transcriptional regulator YtcD n=1 Tax=Paenibacillus albidus TaxID=2041023 RepID=A0A917CAV0_9BACL|nr:helix-turn-helix domain-containing protein [Paenibacillus albidus]GGF80946.1 putative HTH-type transcriptional regulator YtcD [Paenibacillus albidus]